MDEGGIHQEKEGGDKIDSGFLCHVNYLCECGMTGLQEMGFKRIWHRQPLSGRVS